ncbi:MAG: hypothetical protein AAGK97_02625 [Bacteroidota bacterium]
MTDLVSGSELLNDDIRTRINHSLIFGIRKALGEKFSLSLLAPYITQIEKVFTAGQVTFDRSIPGISDLVFLGQVNLVQEKKVSLDFGLGIKLPTGSNEVLRANGVLLAADLQPGTGSWDFIPSFQFQVKKIFGPFWDYNFFSSFRMTTNADRLNGTQKYQFGNALNIRTGFYRKFFLFEQFSQAQFLFGIRSSGFDKTNGFETPNTGGFWINFIPQLSTNFNKEFTIRLFGELPIYRSLSGTQLTTSYRLGLNLSYSF